jgi:hypothetical protein
MELALPRIEPGWKPGFRVAYTYPLGKSVAILLKGWQMAHPEPNERAKMAV